jgi:hypothetical protein
MVAGDLESWPDHWRGHRLRVLRTLYEISESVEVRYVEGKYMRVGEELMVRGHRAFAWHDRDSFLGSCLRAA